MRYTKEYLKENVQLDEVWAALATAGKAALDGLMGAGKKAAQAGTRLTRPSHASFAGSPSSDANRGDILLGKLTGRGKQKLSRISGDGGNKQSTPTEADIKISKYSDTEQRFINQRSGTSQNLTKFPKTK